MTTLTRAEFARRRGVAASTVTRWESKGRLVLAPGGKLVEVEQSEAMLAATTGNRPDVAERHAAEREEKAVPPPGSPATEPVASLREQQARALLERQKNEARIKAAQAELAELDLLERRGTLLRREDVDFVLGDAGAMLRALLDGRAQRLGISLGLVADQVHALAEADELLLTQLAAELSRRGKGLVP